jgi:hypothetical protein
MYSYLQDRSGFISKSEVNALVAAAIGGGEPAPPRLVSTLLAHFDRNADGRITFDEFCAGLGAVREQREAALNQPGSVTRHVRPTWLTNNTRSGVVSSAKAASLSATDIGNTSGQLRVCQTKTMSAPHPPLTGEMCQDLELGTQKATCHIPGYSGFIPSAAHTKAATQAVATSERVDKASMILIETFDPKIKAFQEPRYGSMQTTNSKRTQALEKVWKSN